MFRLHELAVTNIEEVRYLAYEVIFVFVQTTVRIGHSPKQLYHMASLLGVQLRVKGCGELVQTGGVIHLGLG